MHVIHNQFNLATMTSKFNPKAVSIFPKNKTLIQTSNSATNVTQSVTLAQYVDKHDMLDHLTQDEASAASSRSAEDQDASTQASDETTPQKTPVLSDKQQDNGKKPSYYEATPVKTNAATNTRCQVNFAAPVNHSLAAPIITPLNKNIPLAPRSIPANYQKLKIYSSPFLTSEFKPSTENINLTQELEPLRSLILSQHEVFTEPIKDLGNTNLFLTKIIEKKKNSYNQIKNQNKTPRSLRIKCELTTSPSYAEDEDFLKYKEELQAIISDFTEKGTNVMASWAEKNIKLLTLDRCSDLLSKALQILDDLCSFFMETIGTPNLPSLPSKHCTTLFLWKLYLSNEFIEIDDLIEYLGLPQETILTIGAKIITKVTSDDEANSILRPIKLSDINPDDETHESFFSETLTIFHQILYITTVEIWKAHTERNKLTSAALNLKTKRKSLEVFNITASTATAIAKAQDNINGTQIQNLNSSIRITNLEKSFRKQEQKTDKLVKSIHTKNTPKQKNSKGSYKTGSVTSPDRMTPTANKNKNKNSSNHQQKIIDLSEEGIEDPVCPAHEENNNFLSPKLTAKRSNLFPHPTMKKGKMVHWNEDNLATLNTQHLAYQQPFQMLPAHSIPMQHSYPQGPAPYFQPIPPPFHLAHYNTDTLLPPMQLPTHQSFHGQSPFNPGHSRQWPQPQWNVAANPFGNQMNKTGVSTKENPFGTTKP